MYPIVKEGKLIAAGSACVSWEMYSNYQRVHLYRPLLNLYLIMLVISTETAYCTALCWTVGHSKSGCALQLYCCTLFVARLAPTSAQLQSRGLVCFQWGH